MLYSLIERNPCTELHCAPQCREAKGRRTTYCMGTQIPNGERNGNLSTRFSGRSINVISARLTIGCDNKSSWESVWRSPFTFQRSPYSVQRSPFTVQRSPFAVRRSPFAVQRRNKPKNQRWHARKRCKPRNSAQNTSRAITPNGERQTVNGKRPTANGER
jgi:hypothetical protein